MFSKSQLDSKTRQEITRIQAIPSGQRTTAEANFLTALAPYLQELVAGNVYLKEIALTNAQIKALATTAVEIVPALGKGVVAEFLGGVIIHDVGSADFATAHNVTVAYKTDGSGSTVSTTVVSPFITGSVADKITTIKPIVTDVDLSGLDNQPLVIKASANPITGDGVGRVKVWFRIFETGL